MKRFLVASLFAFPAFAQEVPVPKMFKEMQGQKGRYQVEILEGAGRASKGTRITLCTDNLMKDSGAGGKGASSRGQACRHRLLKDDVDEAVMESACKERTTTVTMKRESAKSVHMAISSSGPRGPQEMKMRYTHLGPCREGQGAMSFDKDSEQCRKIRSRAAKMDPVKQCAGAKSDRDTCEQRVREMAAQMSAMCN